MREFRLKDVCLGDVPLAEAVSWVFSYDTLRSVHGNDTKVEAWKNKSRMVRYNYDIQGVQHPLKRFVPHHFIPIAAKQVVTRNDPKAFGVETKVHMETWGARFIDISSRFEVERRGVPELTFLSAAVSVNVGLPAIKHACELLVIQNAQKELLHYAQLVLSKNGSFTPE